MDRANVNVMRLIGESAEPRAAWHSPFSVVIGVLRPCSHAIVIAVGIALCWSQIGRAEDPPVDSSKPLYERMLTGDAAKRAKELQEAADAAQHAEQYDQAIRLHEELFTLRTLAQGADHFDAVLQKWAIEFTRSLAALSLGERAEYQRAQQASAEASRLEKLKQHAEAEPLRQEIRRICTQVFGARGLSAALSCRNLARNLHFQAKFAEAQPLFETALDVRRELLGEHNPYTAESYADLASNLNAQSRYADAQALFQTALDLNRELHGERHIFSAASHVDLASNLRAQGKYAEAQPLLEKALELHRQILGERHPALASNYHDLAHSLYVQAKYAEAQPLFEKALDLNREFLGERHQVTAVTYNTLATNLHALARYAEAQPYFEKALDLNLELLGERHPTTAGIFNNLAHCLNAQAKYAEAQPLFEKALDLHRALSGERHPATATSYNSLAFCLDEQGKYAEAQPLLLKALNLRRELLGERHRDTAISYDNLAYSLNAQGKHAAAQPFVEKALELHRALLGERHPATATSYGNLGLNLHAQARYAEALPFLQKALELDLELSGERHPTTATSYDSLANCLDEQGKYAEAQPLFEKALDLRRELLGERHPLTIVSYSNVACILSAQAEYFAAERLLQTALDLNRELFGERHPFTATIYRNLAFSLTDQAKYNEALPLFIRAAASYEAARLTVAERGLDRAEYGAEHSPYPDLAVLQARLGDASGAWIAAERNLARGLSDEDAVRRRITLTAEEQQRHSAINARLSELQARILQLVTDSSSSEAEQSELSQLKIVRQGLEAELSDLALNLSHRELATLEQVQEALPVDSALVLWVDIDASGAAEHWGCVVRSTGLPSWERLSGTGPDGEWTDEDRVLPLKLRFAALGQLSIADAANLAEKLYAQRLGSLEHHLEGVRRLYVVPVSWMALIPVELLTHRFTISYVPSGTFLARLNDRQPAAESRLLAIGDPVFDRSEQSSPTNDATEVDPILFALRGGKWNDLPGTRVELHQLAGLFGVEATKTLLDSHASEQALEELRQSGDLANYRYLHFATHGEANRERAFQSALILAQDQLPETPLPKAGAPFLNGQLSASEVLEFWNLKADLVTLSACETALGRSGGGDGLLGFAQAFLSAGSRSVCLSLWKVDDTATALLMGRFYQNLLGIREGLTGPMPKAPALAEAKQWLRELSAEEALRLSAAATQGVVRGDRGKGEPLQLAVPTRTDTPTADQSIVKPFAHPRYWSAFILIGDPM